MGRQRKTDIVVAVIRELSSVHGCAPLKLVVSEASKRGVKDIWRILSRLRREGEIFEVKVACYLHVLDADKYIRNRIDAPSLSDMVNEVEKFRKALDVVIDVLRAAIDSLNQHKVIDAHEKILKAISILEKMKQ